MSGLSAAAHYDKVRFNLFERDGSIMISLLMIQEIKDEFGKKVDNIVDTYIAKNPRNIQQILDTLTKTAKNFSFIDGRLHSNYRKKDRFVIDNYEQLKMRPELQNFCNKIDGKLEKQRIINRVKNIKIYEGKSKILSIKKVLGTSAIMAAIAIGGLRLRDSSFIQNISNTIETIKEDDVISDIVSNAKEVIQTRKDGDQDAFEIAAADLVEDIEKIVPLNLNQAKDDTQFSNSDDPLKFIKESYAMEESLRNGDVAPVSNLYKQVGTADEQLYNFVPIESVDLQMLEIAQQILPSTASEEEVRETALSLMRGQNVLARLKSESDFRKVGINPNNYFVNYNLTPTQVDTMKATIQHEAGFNLREIFAVTSTVINRCKSGIWGGRNPYNVITAPGQFSSYLMGYYKKYSNGNYTDATSIIVDAMLTGELEPFHGYERFTSGPESIGTQYTSSGNRFR